MSLFGALALFLAACGIYGVLAYSVAQRRREIGVRMALGAQKRDILTLVLRRGLKLTLVGVAIGLAAASALTRIIQNLLYGTQPVDPPVILMVTGLFLLSAAAAAFLPARRAASVDPMEALRSQ